MTIPNSQKTAIESVIKVLSEMKSKNGKRFLAEMFMDLPDRETWAEYYEVISNPMCFNDVLEKTQKNRYKDVRKAREDLKLIFSNALYYNEESSQIGRDARKLMEAFEEEWAKHSVLPESRKTPPPTPKPTPAVASKASMTNQSRDIPSTPGPSKSAAPPKFSTRFNTQNTPAFSYLSRRPAMPSPEADIDVGGMSPEPDRDNQATADDMIMERDVGGDALIHQLEQSLPKWPGYGDDGWMENTTPEHILDIFNVLKDHKDALDYRLASTLEPVPEQAFYRNLSYKRPLSFSNIEERVRLKQYENAKDFDLDMQRIFEKARRFYEPGTEQYGRVLTLQRLFQGLVSPTPPPGPPYLSNTNFATVIAGPGSPRLLTQQTSTSEGDGVVITTYRVSNKDRKILDEVKYRGWQVQCGDYVHVSNPDDPSRPIVGHVFKVYSSEEPAKRGQLGMTLCWYNRPEQTFHPAHRHFWEREVFKTSHFADHPMEDLIEKVCVQFTPRHIRGLPRPRYWYPGWPLYVCDSRYNDRERIFVRIKNWGSCIPEEVRNKGEWMPVFPFERTIYPHRLDSPFINPKTKDAIKGPGGIGDVVERAEGEKIEGGGTGRKRARKGKEEIKNDPVDTYGPRRGRYIGSVPPPPEAKPVDPGTLYAQPAPPPVIDRSIATAAGGVANLGSNATFEKLPPETARHFDRDPETNEVFWFAAPPVDIPHTRPPRHSMKYLYFLARKHKRERQEANGMDMDAAAEDDDDAICREMNLKRRKVRAPPRATDLIAETYQEYLLDTQNSMNVSS